MSHAVRESGKMRRPPNVVIYPETLPTARVAKGLFGPGTLMISQGLLSSFRDDEVVAVMRRSLELLSQRGIVARTACSACFVELEENQRKPWTPLRAVVFWALLPLRHFLQKQDLQLNVFRASLRSVCVDDRVWLDALRKVSCSERIFS
jgi:hypothetical protein